MAKELYLIDEFDKIHKRIQRPAAAVAKTRSSIKMTRTLDDQGMHDDDKVRHYVSLLHRLLNLRDATSAVQRQPQQQLAIPRRRRRRRQMIPKSAQPTRLHYYTDDDDGEYVTPPPSTETPAAVVSTAPAKTKTRKRRRSRDWASYK